MTKECAGKITYTVQARDKDDEWIDESDTLMSLDVATLHAKKQARNSISDTFHVIEHRIVAVYSRSPDVIQIKDG